MDPRIAALQAAMANARLAGPQRAQTMRKMTLRDNEEAEMLARQRQSLMQLQQTARAQATPGMQNQWMQGMRNVMRTQKTQAQPMGTSMTTSRKNLLTQIGGLT